MILSLAFFAVGFLIAVLTTPWVISLSKRGFGLDHADQTRKRHAGQIPRIGGAPIILAIAIGLFTLFAVTPQEAVAWMPLLVGSALMFALGFADDLKPLGAKVKLAGQIVAAVIVYTMGLSIDKVTYPGGTWSVDLGWWSLPVTVFWLIAIPNIINLIDGFDGLAGGLGLFMAVTLGIVGFSSGDLPLAYYAFTLAGALLGFLVFNFPPARIFLGDGGAYLIGFSIAALSLRGSHKGSIAAVLLVTIVGLGIPILDTTFALVRRAVRGFPVHHADDEHIHHRLENLGFSKRRIIIGIYGLCVVLSLVGLSIFWTQGRTIPIAVGTVFVLALFSAQYLQYIKNWTALRPQVERILKRRPAVQYALVQAQLMELEVEKCMSANEFWPIFNHALQRVGFVNGEAERDPAEFVRIEVRWNSKNSWTLHASRHMATELEWQRIAECFRPVYVRAIDKWRTK
jgi:UDP-GlcNAc:undecaprenyl-phosphate/decaprenyl-phosphate GlcNAc-1-phosphate transferase